MTTDTAARDRSGSRIDHLNIAVPDLAVAVAFYEPVLASIDITKMLQIPADPATGFPAMTGFGLADLKPYFWLVDDGTVGTNMHLAFTVDTRDDVQTFHRAALAAGAVERQVPAVHTQYHPRYYGGFVTDPHGINLEAVCHHRPADHRPPPSTRTGPRVPYHATAPNSHPDRAIGTRGPACRLAPVGADRCPSRWSAIGHHAAGRM